MPGSIYSQHSIYGPPPSIVITAMWIISCLYDVSSTPEYVFLSEDGTFTILSGSNINESTGTLNNHSYLKFGCSDITDLTRSGIHAKRSGSRRICIRPCRSFSDRSMTMRLGSGGPARIPVAQRQPVTGGTSAPAAHTTPMIGTVSAIKSSLLLQPETSFISSTTRRSPAHSQKLELEQGMESPSVIHAIHA